MRKYKEDTDVKEGIDTYIIAIYIIDVITDDIIGVIDIMLWYYVMVLWYYWCLDIYIIYIIDKYISKYLIFLSVLYVEWNYTGPMLYLYDLSALCFMIHFSIVLFCLLL